MIVLLLCMLFFSMQSICAAAADDTMLSRAEVKIHRPFLHITGEQIIWTQKTPNSCSRGLTSNYIFALGDVSDFKKLAVFYLLHDLKPTRPYLERVYGYEAKQDGYKLNTDFISASLREVDHGYTGEFMVRIKGRLLRCTVEDPATSDQDSDWTHFEMNFNGFGMGVNFAALKRCYNEVHKKEETDSLVVKQEIKTEE